MAASCFDIAHPGGRVITCLMGVRGVERLGVLLDLFGFDKGVKSWGVRTWSVSCSES